MSTDTSSARIHIDGSRGEGGGQILRNAVAYAVLLRKSVSIRNIRAGRSKPGLRPQHVTGIRLCRDIAGGTLLGDEVGSGEISYDPPAPSECSDKGEGDGGIDRIVGDTGTAGSVCLLLQAALPVALFSEHPVRLSLRGGTNATMAPQIDYLTEVTLPTAMANFGVPENVVIDVARRGYFPKGGGVVNVSVPSMSRRKLRPINMSERGEITKIRGRAFHAGNCPRWVAKKLADGAVGELLGCPEIRRAPGTPTVEVVSESSAVGSASGIVLIAETTTGCILAGSGLTRPKASPKQAGVDAARELIAALRSGGCVDGWLQDQLVLYMALAEGASEVLTGCLTLHTRSAIEVARTMTGAEFEVIKCEGDAAEKCGPGDRDCAYGEKGFVAGRHLIRCRGIGHSR